MKDNYIRSLIKQVETLRERMFKPRRLEISKTAPLSISCPECGRDLKAILQPNCYDPAVDVFGYICPCNTSTFYNYYFGRLASITIYKKINGKTTVIRHEVFDKLS